MADQPNLGYGKPTEATIDQVNIWMRGQPWYQRQMQEWGQDPGHPNLAKSQSEQILKQAQGHGVTVDEGNMEVDDHGNFNPIGHKLRNTLIVAGAAAAAVAAPYALAALGGGGGSAAGAGAASGLGGVEGGAASGLGAAALPGAGTALGGAAGVGAGAAGAGGARDAAGNFIGDSTFGSGAAGAGGGILDSVKKWGGLGGDILGTVGAVGGALGAAGKGAADARIAEAGINQRQDALGLQRYTDQLQGANTDLAQKRFQLQAPAQRESNAVRGDILANAKDFSYGAPTMVGNIPVPTSSGGLRPSIFSADTKNLGSTIARQSNQAQQSGDVFDPLPQIPGLTPLPQAGASDSILNTAGTVGNLSELLSKLPYGKIATMFGR